MAAIYMYWMTKWRGVQRSNNPIHCKLLENLGHCKAESVVCMAFLWHFGEMAASSQVYQSKRGRDGFRNGGIASPDAKRTNSRTLAHDTALMSLLEKIDNMDNNDSNPDETNVGINGIINSLEDESRLKAETNHLIDSTDEKCSFDQMGSIRQGQLTAHGSTEAISVTPDIWDFTYCDNVGAEFGFSVDLITPHEFGIMINDIYGYSVPHIMYPDALYGYAETTEVFYDSLWEDDIWHLNEHPVI